MAPATTRTELLSAILAACRYLDPDSKGGAHSDVLAIDADELSDALGNLAARRGAPGAVERTGPLADLLARRFLVKRGKIEDFAMRLVGPEQNHVPRATMSHAFGPFGYNLQPTVEKTLVDSQEAARQIPYFASGPRDEQMAPDLLGHLEGLLAGKAPRALAPPKDDMFLSFLDEVEQEHLRLSLYDVLTRDPYFKGKVRSFEELRTFQRFVRDNPLTRATEDVLASFFQAPITVGLRDTLRWAMGSRHPDIGWDRARETIHLCFDRHRGENFLPAEVTYYSVDHGLGREELAGLLQGNDLVARAFAGLLSDTLAGHGFAGIPPATMLRLSRQVLDFHHGYPIYELEPYQGLLSISTVRLGLRVAGDLVRVLARIPAPEKQNRNTAHMERRPGAAMAMAGRMDEADRRRFFLALEEALGIYAARGGVAAGDAGLMRWRRIPRTFHSFQERADWAARCRGQVEETFTLEQLHQPPYVDLLRSLPELSEKLTVFFVLVHRYYKETGFVPDLRPSNAGRDIFLLGIWGYVSENLLITLWRDDADERHAHLSFVDNKDQFKEYRRAEDRRAPVGIAKHALRLTGSLVEPAMLRAIGIFSEVAHANLSGTDLDHLPIIAKLTTKGLDILQEVIHAGIERFFDNTKSAVEDAVDDFFTALREAGRRQ